MPKPSKRRKAPGDYQVGYGRPPSGSRFQPGKSGNHCGRPKGVKSIGQVLADALQRVVTIQEGGRQKKMRMQDVIVQGLLNDAARRDPKAVKLVFALIRQYGDAHQGDTGSAGLPPDDQAIIEGFFRSVLASRDAGTPETPNDQQSAAAEEPEPVANPERGGSHGN
jgi:Family of unknown function (DUF5681)